MRKNLLLVTVLLAIVLVGVPSSKAAPVLSLDLGPDGQGRGASFGETIVYEIYVTNHQADDDEIRFTTSQPSLGWVASVDPPTLLLGAGQSDRIAVTVVAPLIGWPSSTITVVGTSSLDGDVRDAAMTTTRIL